MSDVLDLYLKNRQLLIDGNAYDPRYGGREGMVAAADLATYDVVRAAWARELR